MNMFILIITIIFSNGELGTMVSQRSFTLEDCISLKTRAIQEVKEDVPYASVTGVCVESR